ncbi:NAD/NADP transhydrogenase alpha subunit-like protein [Niveispirillum sp. SYP-B3756]|uniref:NAD/NADP transhydrogenase alpha subunit-like protein n=1 Tax=Niveispirillum sp. SYP-B3756 TaxID=2662178 RepID=UPI001FFF5C2A|nr:NAD/NADP transhydrogenase alpha subunit-like protein [Niveispirillum sp. SYP-B3756]
MQTFEIFHDAMGNRTEILEPSDSRYAIVLAAATAKTVAVPAGTRVVLFNATGPFWVGYDNIPYIPTEDIVDGSAGEYCPSGRKISGRQRLGFIAPAACTVSLSFFR